MKNWAVSFICIAIDTLQFDLRMAAIYKLLIAQQKFNNIIILWFSVDGMVLITVHKLPDSFHAVIIIFYIMENLSALVVHEEVNNL